LLTEPLANDPEGAFNGLVYALETETMIGDVREADIFTVRMLGRKD
jgi:hypothetical protein